MEPQRIIDNKHNNPPSELEILQQRLDENYLDENMELRRLSEKELPDSIQDEVSAGKVTDYIKAAKALQKRFTDAHKKEKSIYLECGRTVDAWKKNYEEKITALVKKAEGPLQKFLDQKAEEERQRQLELAKKAREEAEKLEAQAAEHEKEGIHDTAGELLDAAAQADQKADMIQNSADNTRGSARTMTASASQKKVWTAEIESMAAIDLEALRQYFTEDSIQKALNAAVRDGVRDVRGAKIYQKTQLSVR